MDRLNYQQRLNPSQFGPPVPPRVPLLGQSAGVQTSPEILTWEGMGAGAGVIVETHDVQTSPGLQAGDSAQVSQEEYQTVIARVRMLEQQLADKDAALLQHKTQAATSSRQFKEMLQCQEDEMQIRAHALQKREQEWEQETREANEQRHKEWEQERKHWWGERHQQEEGWRKEKETWEREREALSVKAEQFRKAKEELLSQSRQTQQAFEDLRAQNEQICKTQEHLRQTKDALLNENELFRKTQAELKTQNEQMRQAQEKLLCHNDQVWQAQQADQLRANNLQEEHLNLLSADLAKTDLIRQYQEQEVVLQQEIQRCKREVERVRKGQASLLAQTSQVLTTPNQQSRVQAGSQYGSTTRPQSTSRESLARAPVNMVSSDVIDARPLSQVSAKPLQFTTPSHLGRSDMGLSKGAEGGKHQEKSKARGDAQRSKSLKNQSQMAQKSPSQESGDTIRRGLQIISATTWDNVYQPSAWAHAIARELGQGVLHSVGSPTGEGKQLLTLPPVPSRVSSKQAINMGGSQSNIAQGATSYISSVPQVNCPDMEIFREDGSFMTDETNVSSLDESEESGPDEEEVPDEAIPLGDEFIEGSYSGAIKLGLENPVPLKTSSSHKSRSHVEIPLQNPKKSSGPYQDYRLDNTKILIKLKAHPRLQKAQLSLCHSKA